MNNTDSVIYQRPHYFRGQLLLEDDFLAEQNYHASARRRHNLKLHGSGVVRGFEVTRKTDNSISINAGYAIEESGQEVFLDQSQDVDLGGFGPNEKIRVSLKYEEAGDPGDQQNRRECRAVIMVSKVSEGSSGLTLAAVKLDGQARIGEDAIDNDQKHYVRILAPGSIRAAELHATLKTGWLRLVFRPIALVNVPKGENEIPPPFRVGATEALSPRPEKGQEDNGAAGTMAISLPPSATQVTRLRIAGARNEGKIQFMLLLGGWDPSQNSHARKTLLDTEISNPGPFLEHFDIEDTPLNPEYQTMALWLRGTKRTAISLIAVEFAYH